jgi:hypothetical protein
MVITIINYFNFLIIENKLGKDVSKRKKFKSLVLFQRLLIYTFVYLIYV